MKIRTMLLAAPLLLGCILPPAAGSTEECQSCGAGPRLRLGTESPSAAPDIAIRRAEQADWTYDVTNTGNVKLTNVRVTDRRFAAISCQRDALEAGESMSCTASEPSEAADADSCAVADHVVISEAGVLVTTKGDCADSPDKF